MWLKAFGVIIVIWFVCLLFRWLVVSWFGLIGVGWHLVCFGFWFCC